MDDFNSIRAKSFDPLKVSLQSLTVHKEVTGFNIKGKAQSLVEGSLVYYLTSHRDCTCSEIGKIKM